MSIKSAQVTISIPRPEIVRISLTLVGDSRLVCHKWDEKAKQMMRDKQGGKATKKKEPKVPEDLFQSSLYQSTEGWYGFPATGFKNAAVGACRYTEGITMVMARGTIFIECDGVTDAGVDLVRIEGDGPHMREDMVRISMGTADLRYRGEFRSWSADIVVRFNANILTPEQLFNLFELAGHHVGIGEGRPGAPKSSMDWGMFHVEKGDEERVAA